MINHLIFDTTNLQTVEDTHSVGAYVRSGKSGALVTHHSLQKPSAGSFNFVDADVNVGNDTIAETAHGFQTGDKVQLTSSGTLPAGLALATDYYVIRVDANTIKLAASAYDAEWGIAVDITAAAGGGTHTVTGVEVEMRALDVWLANPSIVVTATDLDIRNLTFANDKVDVSGSTVELGATTLAALETITVNQGTSPWVIGDGGGSITVDGSVSITGTVAVTQSTSPWIVQAGAEKAEDSAHSSGHIGNFMLAVRNDADASMVDADGDYAPLQVDENGRLKVVADIEVANGHEKAEDAAHSSGDIGSYVLAVRQDTLANSVSADGDYASLKVDALGALYVNMTNTISVNDAALANTAIAAAAASLATANVAQNVVASPLSSRKYLFVRNYDNQEVFIGQSGVSSSNGFPLSPGSMLELRAGAAIDIEFVSSKQTHKVRTLELS